MHIILLLILLFMPVSVYAQSTSTPVTESIESITMGDSSIDDFEPQYDYDSETDVFRELGVYDAYSFSMLGSMAGLSDAELLNDNVVALVPFSRSSTTYACSVTDGTIPSNVSGVDGVAGDWTYQQYTTCNNLSGPACAAVLQQRAYYSYIYSDLGRGSSFYISYLSFTGASSDGSSKAPVSNTFDVRNYKWASTVFYKTTSVREARPGVELTPIPSGSWVKIKSGLYNPNTIFRSVNPGPAGKYYVDNISDTQIAMYAVQIMVPAVIVKTFKPRVNVCAVRPSSYDPVKAATAVARATNLAKTATAQVQKPATVVATPPSATYWDVNIQRMWENGREYYLNIYHPNLDLSYLTFYGASGSVPSTLLSGIRIRIYDYDYSLNRVGNMRQAITYTCARGQWCTLTASDIKKNYSWFNPSTMKLTVSCPVTANRVCPPMNVDDRFASWFDAGERANSTKAANSVFSLDPKIDDGSISFPATATAYKTYRTPTRTIAKTFTAVRTNTPLPTVRTATSIGVSSTQSAQTATAQTIANRNTATAYARVVQTATAANATSQAQVTNVVRTATAAIARTQTAEAQITSVVDVTLTAISDWVATQQATQQVYIDTTKTAVQVADDGSNVIQQNTDPQIDLIDDVGDVVGPGEVIKIITEASTALDRGLDSSPCQGFPVSLGGFNTDAGAYAINDDLAKSLCDIQAWLDSDQSFVPFVRTILSVIFVLLFAMLILRIVRGFIK